MLKRHIFVLGLRGFPQVQGGIESHCEHLYPQIANDEFEVTVLVRSPYVPKDTKVGNVNLKSLWSPLTPGVEAFVHTFVGVMYALVKRPDILHFHAIGPSIFAPLARLFGIKVVCTHHGFDYEREKWGGLTSVVLRLGEYLAAKFANQLIAVSDIGAKRLSMQYRRQVHVINNGVEIRPLPEDHDGSILQRLGVQPEKYFLSVSRVVEEKRQLDIINAFLACDNSDYKLIIVGGNGGSDEYYRAVVNLSKQNSKVILAGFQSGKDLDALYYYASAFVHASSLEGNPIVLLEALSYGLPIFASDIPPNLELSLDPKEYFKLGDTVSLAKKMGSHVRNPEPKNNEKIKKAIDHYSWSSKAQETVAVYYQALGIDGAKREQNIPDL